MARHGHGLHRDVPASSLASEFRPRPIRLDLEWLAAVWVPVGRDGTHVLEVGRDGARDLGRDGNRVLGVGRDGARTQGVGRDGARGLEVGRDLLIRLESSGEVNVGANFLTFVIPNIDTR